MTENQYYVDLLLANKNLILTGAPGTGKTYLAKQIAKQMIANSGTIDDTIGKFIDNVQANIVQEEFIQYLKKIDGENGKLSVWYPKYFLEMGKDLKEIDEQYKDLKDNFFEYNSNTYKDIFKKISGLSDEKISEIIKGGAPREEKKFNKLADDFSKFINKKEKRPNPINMGGIPRLGTLMRKLLQFHFSTQNEENLQTSEQITFVQFHPSYDYTDFVEGLRPISLDEEGQIGFELKNGVFKEFCKKANLNLIDSKNTDEELLKEVSIEEELNKFLDEAMENGKIFEYDSKRKNIKNHFKIIAGNSDDHFCAEILGNKKTTKRKILKAEVIQVLSKADTIKKPTDIKKLFKKEHQYEYTFMFKILELLRKNQSQSVKKKRKKFIFIIDEINRGEISKIFGELFFSIEPNYRGIDGKVKTQYQNMIKRSDSFYDGFYIPENVYIIGTMNDIDRSVESFDFAMRRRFVWEEITAEQSAENMELPKDTKNRMKSLNDEISKIEGLNSSYHIGGAYFLNQSGDHIDLADKSKRDDLWKLRLKPLLLEYLRGMSDSDEKIEILKKAYENNGQ
ncbi:MAG: AAA family ATPase [Fibromonadales bacterium]|nr:AAA family ATPase [Fibromonadales bacterium]